MQSSNRICVFIVTRKYIHTYVCIYKLSTFLWLRKKAGKSHLKFLFLWESTYTCTYKCTYFLYIFYYIVLCCIFSAHFQNFINVNNCTYMHMYVCMPVSIYTLHVIQCHHLFISFAPMASGHSSSECCLLLENLFVCMRVRRMCVCVLQPANGSCPYGKI